MSDDGKYLIVDVTSGTQNNLVYIVDLAAMNYQIKGKAKLVPLVTKMDANYGVRIIYNALIAVNFHIFNCSFSKIIIFQKYFHSLVPHQ